MYQNPYIDFLLYATLNLSGFVFMYLPFYLLYCLEEKTFLLLEVRSIENNYLDLCTTSWKVKKLETLLDCLSFN